MQKSGKLLQKQRKPKNLRSRQIQVLNHQIHQKILLKIPLLLQILQNQISQNLMQRPAWVQEKTRQSHHSQSKNQKRRVMRSQKVSPLNSTWAVVIWLLVIKCLVLLFVQCDLYQIILPNVKCIITKSTHKSQLQNELLL